jgi:sec-independent protein translocase protein TatB
MGAPPPIQLSTIGMWDSMFLMLLALVVFGPRRLPQIGRQIGKLMYEFRKASNDFKFQMEEELRVAEDADRRKKEEEERARQLALNPPAATQTIEAQAAIGAVEEQASVSAPPPAAGLEASGSGETPAVEQGAVEAEQRNYPRINPPSTGETVAASRYGANGRVADAVAETAAAQEVATEGGVAAEANVGADPMLSAVEPAADPIKTETVSQHG